MRLRDEEKGSRIGKETRGSLLNSGNRLKNTKHLYGVHAGRLTLAIAIRCYLARVVEGGESQARITSETWKFKEATIDQRPTTTN